MRAVTKVCKHISALSQKFRDTKNGHWFILTPDQLYDQYLYLIPNLPSDTTKWTIQLNSQYYQALTEELRDRMMDNNLFSIPVNNGIPSKEESVAALRVFRANAVRVFKTLTLQEARIERLMKGNCKVRHSLIAYFKQEHIFHQQQTLLSKHCILFPNINRSLIYNNNHGHLYTMMSTEEVYFGHHSHQRKRRLLAIRLQVGIIIPTTSERFLQWANV